uniref:nicotinate phosphoribosyltransferase n=1 Tax=Myxobolus squamalis TaxID=59785 RepID=A0A6B2FYQ4_MYXSQ
MGGFDSTSNVEAASLFNIPVSGTISHSYVSSYSRAPGYRRQTDGNAFHEKLLKVGLTKLKEFENRKIINTSQASESEYEAFVGFASSFPEKFLVIIDTYNVLRSGLPNFCAVALALHQSGYTPIGVRLDSGDLAYLSKMCRLTFNKIASSYNLPWFSSVMIVASNEITIESIYSMKSQVYYSPNS